MRLNAFISNAGVCSRRKATVLVKEGKVKVGGKVVQEPWYVVQDGDAVKVGSRIIKAEEHLYFIVNKPKGITATVEDKFAEAKITDLIPHKNARLYPVGRLDKDSRGLMILTNDGDLCYQLTHPKFEVEKEYAATVKGSIEEKALARIKAGVFNEGEILKIKSYSQLKMHGGSTTLNVVIAEGKKRHLRRLFETVGNPVVDLKRIRIGNLKLGDLEEGDFKKLDRETVYSFALGKKSGRGNG